MVKPPKTMQPEAFDLSKAGRASGKAFKDGSFHEYMARKIDLQRQQFGLVLPPPTPSPPPAVAEPAQTPPHKKRKSLFKSSSPSSSTTTTNTTTTATKNYCSQSRVRFSPCTDNNKTSKRPRQEQEEEETIGNGMDMASILQRLKKRHGNGSRRYDKVREKKKNKRRRHQVRDRRQDEHDNDKLNHDNNDDPPIQAQHSQPNVDASSFGGTPPMPSTAASPSTSPSLNNSNNNHRLLQKTRPDLFFLGVVVKVSGYTDPDNESLKRLLQKHGGDLETYETNRVTHIIAEHLSTAKANMYKKQKRPRPVCRPAWIVDSVREQKLLPHGRYILDELKDKNQGGQVGRLRSLFGPVVSKTTTTSSTATTTTTSTITTAAATNNNKRKKPPPLDDDAEESKASSQPMKLKPLSNQKAESLDDSATSFAMQTESSMNNDNGGKGTTRTSLLPITESEGSEDLSTIQLLNEGSHLGLITQLPLATQPATTSTTTTITTESDGWKPWNTVQQNDNSLMYLEENSVDTNSDVPFCENLAQPSEDEMDDDDDDSMMQTISILDKEEAFTAAIMEQKTAGISKAAVIGEKYTDCRNTNKPMPNALEAGNPTHAASTRAESVHETSTLVQKVETEKMKSTAIKSLGKTDDKYINGKIRTTGTDPNFVETFFSSSRLSFIGSFRQRTSEVSSLSKKLACGNSAKKQKRYVFHVDMDSFFASVVLRNYPQYKNKPVAISHHGKGNNNSNPSSHEPPDLNSVSKKSTSECATCNYKAREYGIKKGMFLGRAKQLCPELVVLYYDFDGYEEVSAQVLEILHKLAAEHKGAVEAVSCDEAYMELFLDNDEEAGQIAESTRITIFEATQCTASIGVADNKFLAKLGTDRAKPDGSFVVNDYKDLLKDLKLRDLHGIGYRSEPKLNAEGLVHVQDIWDCDANAEVLLCNILGPALGKKIFDFCQGKDDRPVKSAERKTIGAECNYGVRFDGPYGIDHFMLSLANEVQKRMEAVDVTGRHVTLKMKRRKKGAKPPPKFLGHGSCHNLSKGMSVPGSVATRDAKLIRDVGMMLFNELAVPLDDIRGMGIIVSKLDHPINASSDKGSKSGISGWLNKGVASGLQSKDQQSAPDLLAGEGGDESKDSSVFTIDCGPEQPEEVAHENSQIPQHNSGFGRTLSGIETARNPVGWKVDELVDDSIGGSEADHVDQAATIRSTVGTGGNELLLMSQIRLSQLQELPEDIREEIESHMEEHSRRKREKGNEAAPRIDGTNGIDALNNTIDLTSDMRKPLDTNADTDGYAHHDVVLGQARFRQMNLKRLMKLAAVKSGLVDTGISLTDLDHLPLEIKLQVVNDDTASIGVLSQRKPEKHASRTRNQNDTADERIRNGSSKLKRKENRATDSRESIPTEVAANVRDEGNTTSVHILRAEKEASALSNAQDHSIGPQGPACVYEEDVLPMKLFLDENEPTDHEAIDQVSEFLSICMREERVQDLATLVRSIRNRGDQWSDKSVLEKITFSLLQEHCQTSGPQLDASWLFGVAK